MRPVSVKIDTYPWLPYCNGAICLRNGARSLTTISGNVYWNGLPVCDDYFGDRRGDYGPDNAKVVCKQLGFSGGTAEPKSK